MSFKTWFIGRDSTSDVVLSDASVSRSHCELTVSGNECLIVDDLSSSGTFVLLDGSWQRVTNCVVSVDTKIKIGNVESTIAQLVLGG